MGTLHLKLVTPERVIFEEEFESITLETESGQITILPDHAPLVTTLLPGEFVVRKGKNEKIAHINGGFATISEGNSVVVLADGADHLNEIDEEEEERAVERARKALEEEQMSSEEVAETEAAILRGLSKLNVVRRRRSKISINLENN
jgi:F-type H+-transporting ATPase subunit epsilon